MHIQDLAAEAAERITERLQSEPITEMQEVLAAELVAYNQDLIQAIIDDLADLAGDGVGPKRKPARKAKRKAPRKKRAKASAPKSEGKRPSKHAALVELLEERGAVKADKLQKELDIGSRLYLQQTVSTARKKILSDIGMTIEHNAEADTYELVKG